MRYRDRMGRARRAALGFRAHTGWAALIAIGGSAGAAEVVARDRIALADGGVVEAEVYHHAREVALTDARRMIAAAVAAARARASAAIAAAVAALRERGWDPVAAGVVVGNTRPPDELEAILRSHAAVHTAEGALYRQALLDGAEACGLAIAGVAERELVARATRALHISDDELRRRVAGAGRALGSPWAMDQKESMIAAWIALATARGRAPSAA